MLAIVVVLKKKDRKIRKRNPDINESEEIIFDVRCIFQPKLNGFFWKCWNRSQSKKFVHLSNANNPFFGADALFLLVHSPHGVLVFLLYVPDKIDPSIKS